ncbi:MAG: hypothetical protein F6K00_34730 [Leptolyngbya sp. SIOISBB]|nr:hypothetical protein [Leptolyngbya sp. SIOISBB]
MSTPEPLQHAYNKYHQLVANLGQLSQWSHADVLGLLQQRDRIQQLIDHLAQQPDSPYISPQFWLRLAEDDKTLGQQQAQLLDKGHFNDWRKSLNPPAHYWWWHLKQDDKPLKLGWLWTGLTLASIPIILALAKDISTRFVTDAPGFWGIHRVGVTGGFRAVCRRGRAD